MERDRRLDLLVAEIQDLRHELRSALGHIPKPGKTWLRTGEFARLVGVTPRTVQTWARDGRFRESSWRKAPRGTRIDFLFHSTEALADVERAQGVGE